MLYNFINPDVPIITPDLEDWDWTDDRSVQARDTDIEEQSEVHHLRYKEQQS